MLNLPGVTFKYINKRRLTEQCQLLLSGKVLAKFNDKIIEEAPASKLV